MVTSNDRNGKGQFVKGNTAAKGIPKEHARKVMEIRTAILQAVEPEEVLEIMHTLVEEAKGGNIAAAREVFDRTIGKPVEGDLLDRMADIEEHLDKIVHGRWPQ